MKKNGTGYDSTIKNVLGYLDFILEEKRPKIYFTEYQIVLGEAENYSIMILTLVSKNPKRLDSFS